MNLLEGADFQQREQIYIKEILSKEDEEDELEAMEYIFDVYFPIHALYRMENTEGRQCEMKDVLELLTSNPHIANVKLREEFSIVRKDFKLAIPCIFDVVNGVYSLIVKTVIRKVEMIDGEEVEQRLEMRRLNKSKVFFSLR